MDSPHLTRAKELLKTAKHAAMATVNEDGSPHNTPYFFMYSPDLGKLYWGSHPESVHSQNIIRTGQLYVVLYDAFPPGGGLYIKAENGHATEDSELVEALAAHNAARSKFNKEPLDISFYEQGPQKMWIADVTEMWINNTERDRNGVIVKDYRQPISAKELVEF
jgi:general stress protein 26